jgi:hypothetical protein
MKRRRHLAFAYALLLAFSAVALLNGWFDGLLGRAATTRYVAQTAGVFSGGTNCNGKTAITPATFNGLTLSAGDLTWVCGTITGSANANILTIAQNGTSGSPIAIQFDTGAIIEAPYCSGTNGCINISGRSWITVNGEATGTIENTANGDSLANQQISILISASPCSNCIIENLALSNSYVAVQNFATPLGGNVTQINAITTSGQNVSISGNTFLNCAWCILDFYGNGDTNHQIFNNSFTNWDHATAFAASGTSACSSPCLLLHDNQYGSNLNWETAGCVYHLDGLHTYGIAGSSMAGVYIYNNYFTGTLSGACSSGFIFMEQGSPNMSNASNVGLWNNVFDASGADGVNPNGWVGMFSGLSGTTIIANNTLICPSSTDSGTVGWGIQQQGATLTFENNVENKCPQGNNINLTGGSTMTADYNAYGNPCVGVGNNCFAWAGSFASPATFTKWKTNCSCDSHSQATSTDTALLLNSNGSPQTGSPLIGAGTNLSTTATGNLATLQNDTTLGNTRTSAPRPTGATAWAEGAFQSGGGASISSGFSGSAKISIH